MEAIDDELTGCSLTARMGESMEDESAEEAICFAPKAHQRCHFPGAAGTCASAASPTSWLAGARVGFTLHAVSSTNFHFILLGLQNFKVQDKEVTAQHLGRVAAAAESREGGILAKRKGEKKMDLEDKTEALWIPTDSDLADAFSRETETGAGTTAISAVRGSARFRRLRMPTRFTPSPDRPYRPVALEVNSVEFLSQTSSSRSLARNDSGMERGCTNSRQRVDNRGLLDQSTPRSSRLPSVCFIRSTSDTHVI